MGMEDMAAKFLRDPGPDCWCAGRPFPTSYVKHTIAVSEQTGLEITSAIFQCPKCGTLVARPEKWSKVDG